MNRLISVLILLTALRVTNAQPVSELSLERIYNSRTFESQRMGPLRWFDDGESFTTLIYNVEDSGFDLIKNNSNTGGQRFLVRAKDLIPAGA